VLEGELRSAVVRGSGSNQDAWQLVLRADPGVTPYRVRLHGAEHGRVLAGTLVVAEWSVTVFPWTIDPREDLEGWRGEAKGAGAMRATVGALDFPYGWGGPRDQEMSDEIRQQGPASDHFGMIARTNLRLPAGRWVLRTLSDDGVRVRVNGRSVVENWSWHGPTRDEGEYQQSESGEVAIEVEHFEIDGFATLVFEIAPVDRSTVTGRF
jgi:hypothetical protein